MPHRDASRELRGTPAREGRESGDPDLGKVLDFMRLLWSVDHELQSLSKRMEARLGITGPQRLALRMVGRFPDAPAGRISEILRVHPSTLTGVLKRLEDRGLIERTEDPLDRRRSLLRLTAAGRRIDTQRSGTVEGALRRAMRRLRGSDLSAAETVLGVFAEELEREE